MMTDMMNAIDCLPRPFLSGRVAAVGEAEYQALLLYPIEQRRLRPSALRLPEHRGGWAALPRWILFPIRFAGPPPSPPGPGPGPGLTPLADASIG